MSLYLDHAATSLPKSKQAIAAAVEAMNLGNAQRGIHEQSIAASKQLQSARQSIARLVGVEETHHVCFLASTTAALNQALFGAAPHCIALDALAHNATYRPTLALKQREGRAYWVLPHDECGLVDLVQLKQQWNPQTDWLVLTHASNVTGIIQPAEDIIAIAHHLGARVIVDAAQTAGVLDLTALAQADMITFSGHKGLRSLPGVGVLLVKHDVPPLIPLLYGGTGGMAAVDVMPSTLPARLEAGTLNLPGIAALAAAADAQIATPAIPEVTPNDLWSAVKEGGGQPLSLGDRPSIPVVSFTLPEIPLLEAVDMLEQCFEIQLRFGLHCAPLAHRTLGTFPSGTLRVSSGVETKVKDLEFLTEAIRSVCRSFREAIHV